MTERLRRKIVFWLVVYTAATAIALLVVPV